MVSMDIQWSVAMLAQGIGLRVPAFSGAPRRPMPWGIALPCRLARQGVVAALARFAASSLAPPVRPLCLYGPLVGRAWTPTRRS